jgi:hypothetical protein
MTDKVDYLDEDPIIPSQKYCVVSVLTPKNFKKSAEAENKAADVVSFTGVSTVADGEVVALDTHNNLIEEHNKVLREMAALKTELLGLKQKSDEKDITMYTFKVRGAYETVDEAQKRIQYLNSIDNNVNIYLAEVGKWCPFEDDPEKAKDSVYKDEELNRLMKGYKENQEKANEHFQQRKAEMVAKALVDTKEKKEKLKAEDDERKKLLKKVIVDTPAADSQGDSSSVNTSSVKVEESLQEKEKQLKENEKKVLEGKKEIEQKKGEIHTKEDKIRKLNDEMNAAKKKYEDMLAKVNKSV